MSLLEWLGQKLEDMGQETESEVGTTEQGGMVPGSQAGESKAGMSRACVEFVDSQAEELYPLNHRHEELQDQRNQKLSDSQFYN